MREFTFTKEELRGQGFIHESMAFSSSRWTKIEIYSKVSSRSLVVNCKSFRPHGEEGDVLKGEMSTTLFVVREDGRVSWRHDGLWGYSYPSAKGGIIHPRYVKPHTRARHNRFISAKSQVYRTVADLMQPHYLRDTRALLNQMDSVLRACFLLGRKPEMDPLTASTIGELFGLKSIPLAYVKDLDSAFDNAVARVHSPRLRSWLHEHKGSLLHDPKEAEQHMLLRTVNEGFGTCTCEKTLNLLFEFWEEGKGYGAINYARNIPPFVRAFPRVKRLKNEGDRVNNIGSYFYDTLSMWKKLSKEERALVHGDTVVAIHDSVTEVHQRFALARISQAEMERLRAFTYAEKFQAMESEHIRLAHPTELSDLGRTMKNCVGGYTHWVLAGDRAIFTNRGSATEPMCIEVGKNQKGALSVFQASTYCNGRFSPEGQEVFDHWAKANDIEHEKRYYQGFEFVDDAQVFGEQELALAF